LCTGLLSRKTEEPKLDFSIEGLRKLREQELELGGEEVAESQRLMASAVARALTLKQIDEKIDALGEIDNRVAALIERADQNVTEAGELRRQNTRLLREVEKLTGALEPLAVSAGRIDELRASVARMTNDAKIMRFELLADEADLLDEKIEATELQIEQLEVEHDEVLARHQRIAGMRREAHERDARASSLEHEAGALREQSKNVKLDVVNELREKHAREYAAREARLRYIPPDRSPKPFVVGVEGVYQQPDGSPVGLSYKG
jgi:hypothetical protein